MDASLGHRHFIWDSRNLTLVLPPQVKVCNLVYSRKIKKYIWGNGIFVGLVILHGNVSNE